MYGELMLTSSRLRLLRFPSIVESDRQSHFYNVSAGFGPAVYDFLRASTIMTASNSNLYAPEETAAITSQTFFLLSTRVPLLSVGPARRTGTQNKRTGRLDNF